MHDTRCDMTHRAYELALGEGLGFWEFTAPVDCRPAADRPRTGLWARLGGGSPKHRTGDLMLHVFDGGLVVERHKGAAVGTPYDAVSATVLDIDRPSGASVALRLTLDGGRSLLLVESAATDAATLTELAERCGACGRARVCAADAEQALSAPDWI